MANDLPVMYGIPNCGTIKKARSWLEDQGIEYQFHDYKKQGLDEEQLRSWIKSLGWEALLNKRGMTWRKLDDTVKQSMDETMAISVMLDNPSIIKRPLIEYQGQRLLGFDETDYQQVFKA